MNALAQVLAVWVVAMVIKWEHRVVLCLELMQSQPVVKISLVCRLPPIAPKLVQRDITWLQDMIPQVSNTQPVERPSGVNHNL